MEIQDHRASKPNGRQEIIAVIPAHNEERFIGSVVLKTRRHVDAVIVVDDGSTDATADIAEAAGAVVVRHRENQGKGVALNTGFEKARELHPDAVVILDGDGQHLPEEVPQVLAPILEGKADIVVGSRYLMQRSSVPTHRVFGHWLFNGLTSIMSRVRATDSQSGFRAFSLVAVQTIIFSSEGFSVESEMQFLAHRYSLRIAEVPITIHYEDKPKRSVITQGLMVLNGVLKLVGQYRPLLFFGVPGMLLLLSGLTWGLGVIDIYRRAQTLAIGYAMIAVLLGIVGTITVSSAIILHSVRGLLIDLMRPKESVC